MKNVISAVVMVLVSGVSMAQDIRSEGPRIERGQVVNPGPRSAPVINPDSRAAKAITVYQSAPVRPTLSNGQPAVQYRKSFP